MIVRTANCQCGQLRAECRGDPVRVSVCHCLHCQQRSGSAFAAQARWPEAQVTVSGTCKTWQRAGDEGGVAHFRFCPDCGSTLLYTLESMRGIVAVAVGAFADPAFPAPEISNYEERKHAWVEITGKVQHAF